VRDFEKPDHYLMMATRKGLVKKTELKAYSRPLKSGIIAIKLKEGDELIDCAITKTGDEIVLATAHGMAIRFNEADARPMGRNTSGVKGVSLSKDDTLVGMVVADPEATLLTACAHGYGKRTPFGPNASPDEVTEPQLPRRIRPSPPAPPGVRPTTMKPKAPRRPSATAPSAAAARDSAISKPRSATDP
jgi:DNA gyrase subunit A